MTKSCNLILRLTFKVKDDPMGHQTCQLTWSEKHFITGGLILNTAQTKLVSVKCYFSPGGSPENCLKGFVGKG